MFSLIYGGRKAKLRKETESTMLVARNLGIKEMGKCWSKCTDF